MPNASARRTYVGISGYDYKPWRGRFYPSELPARRWLEFANLIPESHPAVEPHVK